MRYWYDPNYHTCCFCEPAGYYIASVWIRKHALVHQLLKAVMLNLFQHPLHVSQHIQEILKQVQDDVVDLINGTIKTYLPSPSERDRG